MIEDPSHDQHLRPARLTSQEENTLKSALAFVVLRRRIKARKTTNNKRSRADVSSNSLRHTTEGNLLLAKNKDRVDNGNSTTVMVTPSNRIGRVEGKEEYEGTTKATTEKEPPCQYIRENNHRDVDKSCQEHDKNSQYQQNNQDGCTTVPFLKDSSLCFLAPHSTNLLASKPSCVIESMMHPTLKRSHVSGMVQVALSTALLLYESSFLFFLDENPREEEQLADLNKNHYDQEESEDEEQDQEKQSDDVDMVDDEAQSKQNTTSSSHSNTSINSVSYDKVPCLIYDHKTASIPNLRHFHDSMNNICENDNNNIREQEKLASTFAVLDGIACHLASHLRSFYYDCRKQPQYSPESKRKRQRGNLFRCEMLLNLLLHNFFQPMLLPLQITALGSRVRKDYRKKISLVNGLQQEQKYVQIVLAMCTILHRIVRFDYNLIGAEIIRGLCRVLKSLYHHKDVSICSISSQSSVLDFIPEHAVISRKPSSYDDGKSGNCRIQRDRIANSNNDIVGERKDENSNINSSSNNSCVETSVQRDIFKDDSCLQEQRFNDDVSDGMSEADVDDHCFSNTENKEEWLNNRSSDSSIHNTCWGAKALWVQYPNILACNCLQLLEEIINHRLASSFISPSSTFPASSSSSSAISPGNISQAKPRQRQHQQNEAAQILFILNEELGSELMVPVLSKDMAFFCIKKCNAECEGYSDGEYVDKNEEGQVVKIRGLSSGAKMMVRLSVYEVTQKLSSYHGVGVN